MGNNYYIDEIPDEEIDFIGIVSLLNFTRYIDSIGTDLVVDSQRVVKLWNECILHIPKPAFDDCLEHLIEMFAEEEKYELAQLIKTLRDKSGLGFINELNLE